MNENPSAKEKAEYELRDLCFNKGLNDHDTEIAVDYFIHRLSHKEISVIHGITQETSRGKKSKLKNRLK